MTLEMVIKDIADTVKLSFDSALKAISEKYEDRIKQLENKLNTSPIPEKGEKGDSVTIDDIKPIVIEAVNSIEIPTPKDGKDYDPDELVKAVNAAVEKAVSSIPVPENGKDADIQEINKYILEEIAKLPIAQDGKDGISPTPEEVAKAMEATFAKWAIDFERQANGVLERAIERMPKPKDGRDGIEIKDFDISLGDDLRTVTVSLKSGDTIIEKNIIIPSLIDRGVFSESKEYSLGDGVTYGGSFWIAQKNSPEGKPSSSQDWRLAVKKGKDAKEVVRLPKPTTVKVGV